MASTSTDKQVRIIAAGNWPSQEVSDADKELIKAEFNENLQTRFLSTRDLNECPKMNDLWSYNCLDPLILTIQKEKAKSGHAGIFIFSHDDKYMMVGIWNEKERLFLKDEDNKFKVILPWEDMFDIFWETHLKYCHPDAETLKQILQEEYIVNDFAIEQLNEVCYKCMVGKSPYMRCSLDILSVNGIADYAFTQIMIYQDMYTGYIHLSPISSDSGESEICLELLRLFMDFGPPKELLISNDIFRVALDQITHLTTFAPISIVVHVIKEDKIKLMRLRKTVTKWMTRNEFENWSIACYGVQSYLNNLIKSPGQKSPYDMVFKKIQRFAVEDFNEVECESFEPPNSSDANTDKGVFTTFSPLDFNVASGTADRNSEEQSPSSASQEEPLIDDAILAGICTSDDELMQADAEDPLAIDWAIDNMDEL